ncbi:MAG: winged helix-turn-helix transcriptional regulator [Candidatus Omnitrophota bacterium]|nr:MAG: winged helix-turn-helix transcriptional regulator [Candidatus Omnitrophota bacterium]
MSELENKFLKPTEHLRNLQLLEEISKNASLSQRKLSQSLGLALGMTNACLKKMINKGLVKAKGINHKRIAYYLTPEGFSEKTKLTYHFLEHTIKYYSRLKNNISAKLALLSEIGHRRIVCYGAGEVMEVAFIILNSFNFEFLVLGIVDDDINKHSKKIFGFQVQHPRAIKELKPDAVLITSIDYKDKIMRSLNGNKDLTGINFYTL